MEMDAGRVRPGDDGVGDIITDGGRLPSVTAAEVDDLADFFNQSS